MNPELVVCSSEVGAATSVLWMVVMAMLLQAPVIASARGRHSIGTPRKGRLVGAVRLRSGPGHYVRKAATAWATPTTVAHVRSVLDALYDAHPDAVLRVGDLSARHGGPIDAHRAHQSGRDVDLGLVPPAGVRVRGPFEGSADRPRVMDPAATFGLVRLLAATRDLPGGAQWILLDYEAQRTLFERATAEGIDPAVLDGLFQFPHGRRAERGFVRHFPGHRHHMHVRFDCAPDDRSCRGRGGPPRP